MVTFNIDKETALDLFFIDAMSRRCGRPLTLNEAKEAHSQMRDDRLQESVNEKWQKEVMTKLKKEQ